MFSYSHLIDFLYKSSIISRKAFNKYSLFSSLKEDVNNGKE